MTDEPPAEISLAGLCAIERSTTDTDPPRVLEQMERVAAQPGGLQRLVRTFAGSRSVALSRSLAFLLARAASTSATPTSVAPLVWSMIDSLNADDDWARVNLLSAIQLLGARDALPTATEPLPEKLSEFLADAIRRGEHTLEPAGSALAMLDAAGVLRRLDRATLRDALDTVSPPDDPSAAAEFTALRERLAHPA